MNLKVGQKIISLKDKGDYENCFHYNESKVNDFKLKMQDYANNKRR